MFWFCDLIHKYMLLLVRDFFVELLSFLWRTFPGYYLLLDIDMALVVVRFAAGNG